MIHALAIGDQWGPDEGKTLCYAHWESKSTWARLEEQARTSRYKLVTCKGCLRVLEKFPQLRIQGLKHETIHGESGTLSRQAGDEEARQYWQERLAQGQSIPPWAKALYGPKEREQTGKEEQGETQAQACQACQGEGCLFCPRKA